MSLAANNISDSPLSRGLARLRRLFGLKNPADAADNPATPVRTRPPRDVSLTLLLYCGVMVFIGMAAMNQQANLLFAVAGLMLGILIISLFICRLVLSKIAVNRILPETASVGQATTIVYEFTNRKRFWPSFSITLAELDGAEAFIAQPQAYMLHTAPGMTATIPITVMPKRRGLHRLEKFQIGTGFPFGFIKRAVDCRRRETILIFPALGQVNRALLSLCRSAEKTAATAKPRRGGEDEFYGVREYRAGENPRWIYWKRSARTGALVAKEMAQVSPPRLLLLVDSFVTRRTPEDHVAVERTIARAASLASAAMESGMSAGLCAWNHGWKVIPVQRGKRHCRDILSLLAQLPQNTTAPLDKLPDEIQSMQSEATLVLLTPRDIQLGLSDQAHGSIVVSDVSAQSSRWFEFSPTVHFDRCMPPEQQV